MERRGEHFPIRTLGLFVCFLAASFLVYEVVGMASLERFRDSLNWLLPAALIAACLWTGYKVVAYNSLTLWTPVPWFLAASAVWFGVGPLAYTFGNPDTVAYMDHIFPVDREELFRTNLLNTVGILVITGTFLGALRIFKAKPPTGKRSQPDIARIKRIVIFFLAIGLPLKYLLALPYEFGLLNFSLPGSVFILEHFVLFGLLLLAYLWARVDWKWRGALVLLFLSEVLVEFLRFNKSALILVFLMTALGLHLAKHNLRVLIVGALVTAGVYAVITPIVTWGRNAIANTTGVHYRATLGERLEIVQEGFRRGTIGEKASASDRQAWWSRLCYANVQAFVMQEYDAGRSGDTFSMAVWTVVPRFLWPEKPVITDVGLDFTELLCGARHSFTGIGVFGEAYWNGGWPMVIAVCMYIGVLFAVLSRVALSIMRRSRFAFLPVIFLGIGMGYHIDGWFVASYVGPLFIYLAYLGIIYLLFLKGLRSRQAA